MVPAEFVSFETILFLSLSACLFLATVGILLADDIVMFLQCFSILASSPNNKRRAIRPALYSMVLEAPRRIVRAPRGAQEGSPVEQRPATECRIALSEGRKSALRPYEPPRRDREGFMKPGREPRMA